MLKDSLNPKSMLHTQELSIGYTYRGSESVLQSGLNLKLFESDFVCLIGPNGCGKSTLIRTLGGLQKSMSGDVFIEDEKLTSLGYSTRSQLINTVLTDRTAVDHITVEEVVVLGRYTFTNWIGSLSGPDKDFISNSIHEVGLSGFEDRMLSTLSDGERQRVFIAKALASDAPLLLLDEPTAHLDISNRVEVLTLLRNLSITSGHTCLVSTHDLDLALQLADEIWLMLPDQGMICCTPEEIVQQDYLDEVFGNNTLFFNSESGNFALRGESIYKIQLKESTSIPEYALRTFERLGFMVSQKAGALASIGVDNEGWIISTGLIEIKRLTLSEACRILKKLRLRVK